MNQNDNHESILRSLRSLVPERRLTYAESLRIAELQANRLLEYFDVSTARVPSEIVSEFPRVEVRIEHDLPASGCTFWEGGRWIITLNADEPWVRRRFSMMHEFKHILDHTTRRFLYGDTDADDGAAERAERAADQFAACLLMPKRHLKHLWFAHGQNLFRTAHQLGVSTRALNVRLYYLGLAPETRRCAGPSRPRRRPSTIADDLYLRYSQPLQETVV
jgi:hypothetical protein